MAPRRSLRLVMTGVLLAGFVAPLVGEIVTAPPASAGSGTVSVVAGGTGSGPALQIAVSPADVTVAGSKLYVADQWGSVIRSIDLTTNQATIAAGNGFAGYEGDGGPASVAAINVPAGIGADPTGNLFIADTSNNRIRKVATGGTMTTIAGTFFRGTGADNVSALTSAMNSPGDVVVDAAGNVFYSDTQNQRVRRVDAATGLVTTIAGTGAGFSGDNGPAVAAQLLTPGSLALNAAGDVFIADEGNGRIRRIDNHGLGTITTVVGGGTQTADGVAPDLARVAPTGITFDNSDNLVFSDGATNRVRVLSGGLVTTLAGNGTPGFSGDTGPATAAALYLPMGLAFDGAGNLFIADSQNARVREVIGTTITTIAGNGLIRSSGDGRQASTAQFTPGDPASDVAGNLYIPDPQQNTVRMVAPNGVISTVAGGGIGDDGGLASEASLHWPAAVAIDPLGNLVIVDQLDNRIRRVDKTTQIITTIAGNGSSADSGDNGLAVAAGVDNPMSIAYDGPGNLYIAEPNSCLIRKVAAVTNIITTFAGTPGAGNCAWAGDNGPATSAKLNHPQSVSADSVGNVLIADTFNDRIRKVATNGIITTIAGGGAAYDDGIPATQALLAHPYDAAFRPGGGIYVADSEAARVRVVSPQGTISTVLGQANQFQGGVFGLAGNGGPAASARSTGPIALALDKNDDLLVAENGPGMIRRVSVGAPLAGGAFHPVTPYRAYDSRGGNGVLAAGKTRRLAVASVPVNATAVAINVTVTEGTAASYLSVYPFGVSTPNTSNLQFAAGETVPNMVIVATGIDGAIEFYNQLGSVHYVVDVLGWFDDGTLPGDLFTPTTPTRLLDSRTVVGGWNKVPLGDNETRDVAVRGHAGVPPTATAVVLNLTVTNGTKASLLEANPSGAAAGTTSNVLFAAGETVPNLVITSVGANGNVALYNQHGSVHVVADVMGYFDPSPGGSRFHAVNPTRLLDSRTTNGGWARAPLGPNDSRSLTVTGSVVPGAATAVVLNTTVTQSTSASLVAVSPTPGPVPATTSNLLFDKFQTVPNLVVVGIGSGGAVDYYNQLGAVHVIADALGYFAPT